jgi:hypothetical protein
MFRIFLTIVFLTLCTQTSAKTIRYEFDVVGSNIGFMDLDKFVHDDRPDSGPWKRADWQTGEREYYIRKYHPLGDIYGLDGRVVLDFNVQTETGVPGSRSERTGSISCVSGFLCLLDPSGFNELENNSSNLMFTTIVSQKYGNLFFEIQDASMAWYPPGPPLSGFVPCDFEPDCRVDYFNEFAGFSIENLIRTAVPAAPAPVPLPAAAWLLGVSLLTLGLIRRRGAA